MSEEEQLVKGPCFFNHASSAHSCDCYCDLCLMADEKFATLPYYRRQEIMAAIGGS